MIKFSGVFCVTLVVLAINGIAASHSLKVGSQDQKSDKLRKAGFFDIFDDLLEYFYDEDDEDDDDGQKDEDNKEVLICRNCTIIVHQKNDTQSGEAPVSNGPTSIIPTASTTLTTLSAATEITSTSSTSTTTTAPTTTTTTAATTGDVVPTSTGDQATTPQGTDNSG